MDSQTRELWKCLQTFDFDAAPAAFTFRDRLARDNGWPRRFATRVLDEYRRFLLLAARAGHPATPSDEVDQAWHLHLTYTQSYWEDLCGRVLRAPLHHGPTRGGAPERAKFADWYARTLASYRLLFGEEPPADIWPPASVRFGRAPHYRRLDTSRVWVIRKPAGWTVTRHPVAAGLLLAFGATAGCAASGVPWQVPAFLVAGVVAILLLARRFSRGRRDSGAAAGGDGSSGGASVWMWGGGDTGSRDEHGNGHDQGGSDGGGNDSGGSSDGGSGCGGGCGS